MQSPGENVLGGGNREDRSSCGEPVWCAGRVGGQGGWVCVSIREDRGDRFKKMGPRSYQKDRLGMKSDTGTTAEAGFPWFLLKAAQFCCKIHIDLCFLWGVR